MSTNPTAVSPPAPFAMAATEIQTVAIDCTVDLEPGESILGATGAMTNADTGAAVTLSYTLTVIGATIQQTFAGVADGLVAGQTYRYRVTFTATPLSGASTTW